MLSLRNYHAEFWGYIQRRPKQEDSSCHGNTPSPLSLLHIVSNTNGTKNTTAEISSAGEDSEACVSPNTTTCL